MENYLDESNGPNSPDEVENLKKKFKTDSTIGCGCLVLIILTALICGIGFILFISHLIQHYRL